MKVAGFDSLLRPAQTLDETTVASTDLNGHAVTGAR